MEAADLADKYDRMLRLADLFDSSGQEMRARAKLGAEILRDEGVAESSELSKTSYDEAADDIRSATTGQHGLLTRSDRARRRRAGGARHGVHLPLDRRAPGGGVPDARFDRRPRHRLPRAQRRARWRDRLGGSDRDRRARPRRHRRLPQRARRGQPRPDGPHHQWGWWAGRGPAAALAADLRSARGRPRPDGGGGRAARDRGRAVRGRDHGCGARRGRTGHGGRGRAARLGRGPVPRPVPRPVSRPAPPRPARSRS